MSHQEFNKIIGKCVILKYYKNYDEYYFNNIMLNEGNQYIHRKRKEIKREIYNKTRELKKINKNIFIFLLGKFIFYFIFFFFKMMILVDRKLYKKIKIFLLGWYFDENSTLQVLPAEIILSIAQKAYYSEGWPEYLLPLVEMRFVLFLRTY